MEDGSAARQGLRLISSEAKKASGKAPAPSGIVATSADTSSIRPGVVVNGKYLVGNVIGEGGVGIVYEAQNLELDEKVALKCLRSEMLVESAIVARFAHEAKAAASIKSEYVATVHDVGTMPDGAPYMVMEFLDGLDLGNVVHERGVLGPRAASEYGLQVCEALAVAHAKGIVHRDIKPENLMLTERAGGMRIVKVLDFGISKAALTGSIFRNDLPLVKTVSLMGTPLYMSPEQVRNTTSVDVRSDIWSLGMVLYELLTGTTAFTALSITEVCAAILESAPQPIEVHRRDLPTGLVEVIRRCLEKDPARRYQNVAELAIALMPFGPKRARLNVERSIAVLQGSGQLDSGVRLLSTVPPPNGDVHLESPLPAVPRLPTGISALPTVSTAPPPDLAPAQAGSRNRVFVGVFIALAAIAIGLVASRRHAPPTATTNATTAPPAMTAPAAPAAPEAAILVAAPVTATTTTAPAATAVPAARPGMMPPAPMGFAKGAFRPVAKAPVATSSAPPKTADEPDLGY